jgi:uncharacterized protein (DUF362 family)
MEHAILNPGQPSGVSRVALVRCGDYREVEKAIRHSLGLLGGLPSFAGKTVLLKVNLMKGTPPGRALNTHPDFVRACVRVFREAGATVQVGDSSGILGRTWEAFEASGIADAVQNQGATLLNFDASRLQEIPLPGTAVKRVWVPQEVLKADVLVTLPKLKTHPLMKMTGAVKNQVGVLPGGSKCRIHQFDPRPGAVAKAIVALNLAIKPMLGIVDGIWGIDSGASASGKRRDYGIIAASSDLVALDNVCARVMDIPPESVPTIRLGAEMGLGVADSGKIEVLGETIEACRAPARLPRPDWKGLPVLGSHAYRIRGSSFFPRVDAELCEQCHTCSEVCPVDAVEYAPLPRFTSDCIYCYSCCENCPSKAIRLDCRWYLKKLVAQRAEGLIATGKGANQGENSVRP